MWPGLPCPSLPFSALLSNEENTTAPRVALVTGGSAGLGLVIAETFANAQYLVVIAGRSPDRLEQAKRHLENVCNAVIQTVQADLSDHEECMRVADEIKQRFGRLDVLVNCIGTSDRGLIDDLSADRLRELVDQNVVPTLLCCQSMMPLLELSKGSIVNIGSLAGKVGARYLGGYNIAKHALTGLTQQMRLEWKPKEIHVALVSPGPIRRSDAGTRYSDKADGSIPASASAPGGGTKVKGLEPQRVADAVLKCAQKRKTDVILPKYLRLLIVLGNAFPRLGDWLLIRFTS